MMISKHQFEMNWHRLADKITYGIRKLWPSSPTQLFCISKPEWNKVDIFMHETNYWADLKSSARWFLCMVWNFLSHDFAFENFLWHPRPWLYRPSYVNALSPGETWVCCQRVNLKHNSGFNIVINHINITLEWSSLIGSRHWIRRRLGASRQQAITWTSVTRIKISDAV